MAESSPTSPPNRRGIMTITTILPIILGLLLALIIKKFYYSIVNKKIDIDIEKQKETETEAKVDEEKEKKIDKNHWLKARQKQLVITINRIEAENKDETYNLSIIKKLSEFLDRNDSRGSEFAFFDELISCYYFDYKKIKHLNEYLIFDFKKKEEQLKLKKNELEQKQQELELREAKIIKIEASQKILNSELVEKINKEID